MSYAERQVETVLRFHRLFSSEDGRAVLRDLKNVLNYGASREWEERLARALYRQATPAGKKIEADVTYPQIDPVAYWLREGERRVVFLIEELVEQGARASSTWHQEQREQEAMRYATHLTRRRASGLRGTFEPGADGGEDG